MEAFLTLVVLAVLVEAVTEWVDWLVEKGMAYEAIVALIAGQVLAWGANLDLLAVLNVEGFYGVGYVLSGIIISRGSNYVHDLLKRIQNKKAA